MKRLAFIVIAFLATAVGLGVAAPAQAATGVVIRNVAYGECILPAGSANGAPIGHLACNGNVDRQWIVESAGNYTYCDAVDQNGSCLHYTTLDTDRFRNVATGLCLDVDNNGTASGTVLVQHYCSDLSLNLNQQRFHLIPTGAGTYYVQSIWAFDRTRITRVMDCPPHSQSDYVRLWTHNATAVQQWSLA